MEPEITYIPASISQCCHAEITYYIPSKISFGRELRLPSNILFCQQPDAPSSPEEYMQDLRGRFDDTNHSGEPYGVGEDEYNVRHESNNSQISRRR